MIWFWISASFMVTTAIVHSLAGERKLIGPLLAMDQGVMASRQSRKVLRSAWHLTSAFMISNAIVVAWPRVDPSVKAIIGVLWLAVGLMSLISTRGRHVGWPWLTGAGLAALLGSAT